MGTGIVDRAKGHVKIPCSSNIWGTKNVWPLDFKVVGKLALAGPKAGKTFLINSDSMNFLRSCQKSGTYVDGVTGFFVLFYVCRVFWKNADTNMYTHSFYKNNRTKKMPLFCS